MSQRKANSIRRMELFCAAEGHVGSFKVQILAAERSESLLFVFVCGMWPVFHDWLRSIWDNKKLRFVTFGEPVPIFLSLNPIVTKKRTWQNSPTNHSMTAWLLGLMFHRNIQQIKQFQPSRGPARHKNIQKHHLTGVETWIRRRCLLVIGVMGDWQHNHFFKFHVGLTNFQWQSG